MIIIILKGFVKLVFHSETKVVHLKVFLLPFMSLSLPCHVLHYAVLLYLESCLACSMYIRVLHCLHVVCYLFIYCSYLFFLWHCVSFAL